MDLIHYYVPGFKMEDIQPSQVCSIISGADFINFCPNPDAGVWVAAKDPCPSPGAIRILRKEEVIRVMNEHAARGGVFGTEILGDPESKVLWLPGHPCCDQAEGNEQQEP